MRVIDTFAIAYAARHADAGQAALTVALSWGGAGAASIIGDSTKVPAATAALVNGTYAHSLDFDDTHLPSVIHPSASLVPTAAAGAEEGHASGAEFLTSLVAGYEILCRLANAQFDPDSGTSLMFERGVHGTSIMGAVASAMVAGRLRKLDAEGIANSGAIACSMGAGIIESNRTGGSIKRLHCGWAGHSAITAAALAEFGLSGSMYALEGECGLLNAFCGTRWQPSALCDGLGEKWLTPDICFKPYPCNHFTHAVVDAVAALRCRGLTADAVRRVEIGTADATWRIIGDPILDKQHPQSPYHAAFSAPFVFAAAMLGASGAGGVGLADFSEEALADPARIRLAEMCSVVVDDQCSQIFPRSLPAVVRVWAADGAVMEERVDASKGTQALPLDRADVEQKAIGNVGAEKAQRLAAAVDGLSRSDSVGPVFAALWTAGAVG